LPSAPPPVTRPWIPFPASFIKFPLAKKEALKNPMRAAVLFLELFVSPTAEDVHTLMAPIWIMAQLHLPSTSLRLGVLHAIAHHAELIAIEKALQQVYDTDYSAFHNLSDSQSSFVSIFNNKTSQFQHRPKTNLGPNANRSDLFLELFGDRPLLKMFIPTLTAVSTKVPG
jgi:hypothetical protein